MRWLQIWFAVDIGASELLIRFVCLSSFVPGQVFSTDGILFMLGEGLGGTVF